MSYHGGVRRLTQMGSVVDAVFDREIERREVHLADGSMSTGYNPAFMVLFKRAPGPVQNRVRAIERMARGLKSLKGNKKGTEPPSSDSNETGWGNLDEAGLKAKIAADKKTFIEEYPNFERLLWWSPISI